MMIKRIFVIMVAFFCCAGASLSIEDHEYQSTKHVQAKELKSNSQQKIQPFASLFSFLQRKEVPKKEILHPTVTFKNDRIILANGHASVELLKGIGSKEVKEIELDCCSFGDNKDFQKTQSHSFVKNQQKADDLKIEKVYVKGDVHPSTLTALSKTAKNIIISGKGQESLEIPELYPFCETLFVEGAVKSLYFSGLLYLNKITFDGSIEKIENLERAFLPQTACVAIKGRFLKSIRKPLRAISNLLLCNDSTKPVDLFSKFPGVKNLTVKAQMGVVQIPQQNVLEDLSIKVADLNSDHFLKLLRSFQSLKKMTIHNFTVFNVMNLNFVNPNLQNLTLQSTSIYRCSKKDKLIDFLKLFPNLTNLELFNIVLSDGVLVELQKFPITSLVLTDSKEISLDSIVKTVNSCPIKALTLLACSSDNTRSKEEIQRFVNECGKHLQSFTVNSFISESAADVFKQAFFNDGYSVSVKKKKISTLHEFAKKIRIAPKAFQYADVTVSCDNWMSCVAE